MKGAIFYASKYGSTGQYADWIAEATGLPVFHIKDSKADPSRFDFLILGAPILYYKLHNHKWVKRHLNDIVNKPVIFFSVSGAPAGEKLDGWIADSLPSQLISKMYHVALRGRQIPKQLTWYDRILLIIGGLKNPDPVARKEEMKGFDYMDRSSIAPIVTLVEEFQAAEVVL